MTTQQRPCPVDYPHAAHGYLNEEWGGSRTDEPYKLRCPGLHLDQVKALRVFPISVRREVLRQLRAANRYLAWQITDWAVSGTVHAGPARTSRFERPRKVEEWPENSRESWTDLADRAQVLADMFGRLARDARDNARTISGIDEGK